MLSLSVCSDTWNTVNQNFYYKNFNICVFLLLFNISPSLTNFYCLEYVHTTEKSYE
jgi:hypothetical protein